MAEQVSSLKTGIKYKKTPIGEIPVDWELVRLGDICEEIYQYPTYYNIEYVGQDGVPEVRGELIRINGELSSDPSEYRYISKETSANFPRTILHEGDFVLSVRGTMGKIGHISSRLENANMTANLMRISPNRIKVYPLWLKQIFLSEFFQNRLEESSSATTIKTIKAPELKAIEIALPPLLEQKEIADILTILDEAIEKTDQIIEKTKETKTGLMQKLLTRGIGHKKFKETEIGEIPEEWSLLTLEEIVPKARGSIKRGPFGGAIKKEFFVPEGYKVYEQKNVIYNDFELGDYYIDEDKFEELKDFQISQDDLLISCSGTIGRIVLVPRNVKKGIINQALLRITLDEEKMMPEFFKHFFETDSMQKKVISHTHGSAMKNIVSMTELKKIQFVVPSIEEQNKIVELINGVDSKVEDEQAYKSELEQLKKGLMQVLLTGKIRVIV